MNTLVTPNMLAAFNAFVLEYLVPKFNVKNFTKDNKLAIVISGNSVQYTFAKQQTYAYGYTGYYPTMCGMYNLYNLSNTMNYTTAKSNQGKLLLMCMIMYMSMRGISVFTCTHNQGHDGVKAVHKLIKFMQKMFPVTIVRFKNLNSSNNCEHITVDISELTHNFMYPKLRRKNIGDTFGMTPEFCNDVLATVKAFLETKFPEVKAVEETKPKTNKSGILVTTDEFVKESKKARVSNRNMADMAV